LINYKKEIERMKKLLGVLFIITGIIGGLFVGGWLMFIQPIISACKSFDAGTLTGTIVGITVLKCIFAGFVGGIIIFVGCVIGKSLLMETMTNKVKKVIKKRY
jgi:hypothetical protein